MFIHLHLHTPYSFLDGASEIEALVRRAAAFGMPALAMTDHNSVAAAVKFTVACRRYGIMPILGSELTLKDGSHLTLLAQNRAGYSNLCRLLTASFAHGGRLSPALPWDQLPNYPVGLICLSGCRRGRVYQLVREHRYDDARHEACRLRDIFGRDNFYIELQQDAVPDSRRVCRELALLAEHLGVGAVATNNVHYAGPDDYITHDILRAIATQTEKEQVHPDRPFNSQRFLKSPQEMESLFGAYPAAIANTLRITERCEPALPENEEVTPRYPVPNGGDAPGYLRHLTYLGARARYKPLTPAVTARLDFELEVISTMGYADYFLMVWEIVRAMRKEGIRATGRGSAADSCVAYALTLTDVDVIRRNLPFARFLSPGKIPDIDMDFPSERRDDVFRYIIRKYGEEHTGMVCTFHTFWARSALRDVAKAMAIPPDAVKLLSKTISQFVRADRMEEAFEQYAELRAYPHLRERFKLMFSLCARIAGFPRHLGTHSSGIVISRQPLATLAPVTPSARGITQIWTLDKDDAEVIGAIKFDVLSLRALSAVADAERDIARRDTAFRYDRIPEDDEETYRMFRSGSAVGTFQFESPAQLALGTVLGPEHFEDLVASVALIRPGPIRGDGVNRYVAARNGWCRADILHPCLAPFLEKTGGVIVFQEQVIQVVAAMVGCTETDADKFRKSLTRHHKMGTMEEARAEFIARARALHPDFSEETGELLFDQLAGWCGYGFTEGHAASFALTGYRTAYISVHHAAEFFAGMMNHQPMGYYNANSLAAEARRRGVNILPVDINASGDKCVAEAADALRLGFRLVSDLRESDIASIEAARRERPFVSLLDLCARVLLPRDALENLILAGAFDTLHEHRRGILWRLDETIGLARSYREESLNGQTTLSMGNPATLMTPVAWDLEDFSPWESFLWTWRLTGVCAECHLFTWLREALAQRRVITAYEAQAQRPGARVTVAGLNICPHRPPTRSGKPVLFSSLEDESGLLQLVLFGEAIEKYTGLFLTSPAVLVRGKIVRKGAGASLAVEQAKALRPQDWLTQDEPFEAQEHATADAPSDADLTLVVAATPRRFS